MNNQNPDFILDFFSSFIKALELLVERCLSSATQPLSPGEALRRVFECLSSGLILPCTLLEKYFFGSVDIFD